jgi:hypothetical protein
MSRWTALAATLLLVASSSRTARGEAPAPSPPPPAPSVQQPSPKRPLPDYDGRGGTPLTAGERALWGPRVLLSPVYLVTEYVLRRPLGMAVSAAEHADVPRKLYDFFAFGPEHKAGFVPVGFVEFNFNPSVGVYAFWDDAGFRGNDLRLHAEAWPGDWLAGSLTQRIRIDPQRTFQLRVSGMRRPDHVFYGLGPASLQRSQSRYGEERFEGTASHDWGFWRSSRVETAVGLRDVRTYDGRYGTDPPLTQQAAAGAFSAPEGFGSEYTAQFDRVVAAVDTRTPADRPGSGLRFELGAEQVNEVRQSPASGWLRYGATAAGFVDLNGRSRVLGLSVTALFVDPLGSRPVPFPELVYLGGDHPMPAYFAGRLVDRSAAAATASYSWPIGLWLDGRLEVAAGNVFGTHLASFDPRSLRFSGAFGLSVAGLHDVPLELLLGLGTETIASSATVDSVRLALGVPHTF